MKKPCKKILSVLLAAMMLFGVLPVFEAAAKTSGVLTYEVKNGEVTITGCKESASGKIKIPSKINGYPVTKIGKDAFYCRFEITSVDIPDTVKSIGKYAFLHCTNLSSVNIPDKVTVISEGAFGYCDKLKSISIPKGVTSIEDYAFEECIKLKNVTIPDGVKTIGIAAFANCSIKNLTIPDSVTNIGEMAFTWCEKLTSVKIGKGIKKIEPRTFEFCSSLKSVTFPEGLTSIEDKAFDFCGNLKSVRIPKSVTKIGTDSFGYDRVENHEKVSGFTIYGYKDSAASKYAKNNGFKFVAFKKVSSVTLSSTSYTYDGNAKKPTVTVKDSSGKKLKEGTDYTVKYSSGRKNVGKYTVTVTFKGNYDGEKKLTFTINPKPTSISSLTAGKGKFTAKWKKQSTQVSGYQIRYSASSKMTSAKTKTITNSSTTSKTVSGLKSNTRYYVQIRTYKTVSGTTYYSSWSNAKSIKTK